MKGRPVPETASPAKLPHKDYHAIMARLQATDPEASEAMADLHACLCFTWQAASSGHSSEVVMDEIESVIGRDAGVR